MSTINPDRYEYRHQSLVELRAELKLKQSKMAELLGVPANTLSRWETGATTPDATALAKFYSIALSNGKEPKFFRLKGKNPIGRGRLLVMWDFQNSGIRANRVDSVARRIRETLDIRFAGASYRRFKAFGRPDQTVATDKLVELGWRVWEDDEDMDDEIDSQARSECGQVPKDTTLTLIANDGDYADLIGQLKNRGVEVYVLTPTGSCSNRLKQAVGGDHVIALPD